MDFIINIFGYSNVFYKANIMKENIFLVGRDMKKKLLLLATVLSTCMTFSAFAGEWKQDEKGW